MSRQTLSRSRLLNLGRYLLGISLCLGICTLAHAGGNPGELDTQTLNSIAQCTNAVSSITCGKLPGQRPDSLNIRSTDIITLWRSTYHMLFPGYSLADNGKDGRVAMIPHKGPTWGISIIKHNALITVQTKW